MLEAILLGELIYFIAGFVAGINTVLFIQDVKGESK